MFTANNHQHNHVKDNWDCTHQRDFSNGETFSDWMWDSPVGGSQEECSDQDTEGT